MPERNEEQYSYQVDKITFVVTPIYKESSETILEILLKLMQADLERT